jgi:curved DNA-binding protein CbpA
MEKSGYIKQLKKLIKKYHPDLCTDENLKSAYNEITIKLNSALEKLKSAENTHSPAEIKDPGYACYKLGIKYYRYIHPGQFYKKTANKTFETKTYEDQLEILNKIFISFNLSEFYFNKVISEYKSSEWAEDAKEKIKLLKKLYKSYENINVEENSQIINAEQFVNEMGLKTMF